MSPAPYLSVLVPTYRTGGLDVLFSGLANQTFKDFELVLVDALWRGRKAITRLHNAGGNFTVQHLEPKPISATWPACSFCAFANAGISVACGTVIVQFADYTWAPPDLLAKHAKFHQTGKGPLGFMGPQQYLAMPPLDARFPKYEHGDLVHYAGDIELGALDPLLWSIFAAPMTPASHPDLTSLDPIHGGADLKLKCDPGRIEAKFFHAKNESFKRTDALAINGYDLDLDGTNLYQDTDFAERLTIHRNVDWYVDPTAVAYIVNPRHIFPRPQYNRPSESNLAIWQEKKKAGYPPVRGIR